jgi:hypothetical protein
MAEPQLLVDQPDRLVDRGALVGRDADVRQRQELQDMVVLAPDPRSSYWLQLPWKLETISSSPVRSDAQPSAEK